MLCFRFKNEIPSSSYVEVLAESMHLYEPEHYIAGGELYLEYKPELIAEVLNKLTPEKVNVIIYSQEKKDSFYNSIEPWFQTKHKIEGKCKLIFFFVNVGSKPRIIAPNSFMNDFELKKQLLISYVNLIRYLKHISICTCAVYIRFYKFYSRMF